MNAHRSLLVGLTCLLAATGTRAACMVDTLAVAFGNYNPIADSVLDGVGSIHLECSPATSYSLGLSSGAGSFALRQLSNGSNTLDYNLYSDPSHSSVWGDGSGVGSTVSGSGDSVTHTVYGRIASHQSSATAGSYSDLIVVTVEF